MPYSERKAKYAQVGRIIRAPGVDAAVIAKYELAKSDAERFEFMRCVIVDPTLASIEISDEFRNEVYNKNADLYVTAA